MWVLPLKKTTKLALKEKKLGLETVGRGHSKWERHETAIYWVLYTLMP
jgi:hypothetical protein